MNTTSQFSTLLHEILTRPTDGIVGLVDELLTACGEHSLQLDWYADRCLVRPLGGDWEELTGITTLRKSVFRAVLARVAALCNEQCASSVSPYGGQSELSIPTNRTVVIRVKFVNTATTQRLELAVA